ncbi:MAG: sel1 repeat family protein, partial [Oxalobacteraceae bacterium]
MFQQLVARLFGSDPSPAGGEPSINPNTDAYRDQPLYHQAMQAYAEEEYATAFPLLSRFAQQGDAEAQYRLGLMHINGEGTPQDTRRAVRLLTRAADQNNASAQLTLGVLYQNGWGVPQDSNEGERYLQLAAAQGESVTQ